MAERKAKSKEREFWDNYKLPQIERSCPPRDYLAVVAIVRDEAPYIAEWIEFHRLMGVDHFYVYDDVSTDGTTEILAAYAAQGVVTVIPWRSGPETQRASYAHALCSFGRHARWMMFIDVDEFVFPTRCDSLHDALASYEDLPSLVLPWRMFGHSGHKEPPPGLVIENYVKRAATPLRELRKVKSIVDPTRVTGVHVHEFPTDLDRNFTPSRSPWSKEHCDDAEDPILINHYFTKSEAEFAAKLAKNMVGRETPEHKKKSSRAKAIETATLDDHLIQRFVPALKALMRDSWRASG